MNFLILILCFFLKTEKKTIVNEKVLKFKKGENGFEVETEEEEILSIAQELSGESILNFDLFTKNEIVYILTKIKNENGTISSVLIKFDTKERTYFVFDLKYHFIDMLFHNDFFYFVDNNYKIACFNQNFNLLWFCFETFLNYGNVYKILISDYFYLLRLDQLFIIDLKTGYVVQKLFLDKKYENLCKVKNFLILYSDNGFFLVKFDKKILVQSLNEIVFYNNEVKIFENKLYFNNKIVCKLNNNFVINSEYLIVFKNTLFKSELTFFNLKTGETEQVLNDFLIKSIKFENNELRIEDVDGNWSTI